MCKKIASQLRKGIEANFQEPKRGHSASRAAALKARSVEKLNYSYEQAGAAHQRSKGSMLNNSYQHKSSTNV